MRTAWSRKAKVSVHDDEGQDLTTPGSGTPLEDPLSGTHLAGAVPAAPADPQPRKAPISTSPHPPSPIQSSSCRRQTPQDLCPSPGGRDPQGLWAASSSPGALCDPLGGVPGPPAPDRRDSALGRDGCPPQGGVEGLAVVMDQLCPLCSKGGILQILELLEPC